jgi:Holliday junction resolvase
MESIGVIGKTGVVGAARINAKTKSKHVYTPDLVVKKGNEICIVEVKTNSGNIYLKPEKVKGLLSARRFGLIPLLINLNVSIDATDFMMRELRATPNRSINTKVSRK